MRFKKCLKIILVVALSLFTISGMSSCSFGKDKNNSSESDGMSRTVTNGLNTCIRYLTQSGAYECDYFGLYAHNKSYNKVVYQITYKIYYQGVVVSNYATNYFLYNVSTGELSFADRDGYNQYVNGINNGTYSGVTGIF